MRCYLSFFIIAVRKAQKRFCSRSAWPRQGKLAFAAKAGRLLKFGIFLCIVKGIMADRRMISGGKHPQLSGTVTHEKIEVFLSGPNSGESLRKSSI